MTGYDEARVSRTVAIWAHGAAQGVWKESIRRVDEGREETCELKSASVVISETVDMVAIV